MRALFVLIPVGFAVSGCLPPIIVAANYASDGILLATTGKTKTEIIISGLAKKDCSTFRVVQGKEICQEWKEGHQSPEVALGPGSDVVPPPQDPKANNSNVAKAPVQPVTTTANLPQQTNASAPADTGTKTVAPTPAPAPAQNMVRPAPQPVAAPAAPVAAVEPAKQKQAAPQQHAAVPAVAPAPASDDTNVADTTRALDYIVVLGVVRAESGALSIARRYRNIAADARLEQVDARHWRVVSGPYVEYEAFNMRDTLRDNGLVSANVAPCTGKCLTGGQAVRPPETKPAVVKKPAPQARRAPAQPSKTQIAASH